MPLPNEINWNVTIDQAIALQIQLNTQVITEDQVDQVEYVGGVDGGFSGDGTMIKGAVVVLKFPELELVESAIATLPVTFPYISGLLSFREIPVLLQAMKKLKQLPDLILCDGQGIAHPRRFGIACHLGVLLDIPTIGVAKTLFIGKHDPVGMERGSWQPLIYQDNIIGCALRTRNKVNPLYVSIGHRISLNQAINYVLQCAPKYRLPQTTRLADQLAAF